MRDYEAEANNIIKTFTGFYLKLNIKLPSESLIEAKRVYNEGYFAYHKPSLPDHPEGAGWYASCLHGLGWDKVVSSHAYGYHENYTDQDVPMKWTEICELAPETTRFFKEEFPISKGDDGVKYRRLRFMLLKPGGIIPPHFDYSYHGGGTILNSLNFALNQPNDCFIAAQKTGKQIPYEPFYCYAFNSSFTHYGQNNSNENRFHILCQRDKTFEKSFWKIFVESFEDNYDGHVI